MLKILPLAFVLGALAIAATGCTPTSLTSANTALAGVGTGAAVASGACKLLLAGSAGTVCGAVASDVSAVASLVESILKSLPPADAAAPAVTGSTEITYRGTHVTVSSRVADQVRAGLAAASAPSGS